MAWVEPVKGKITYGKEFKPYGFSFNIAKGVGAVIPPGAITFEVQDFIYAD